jgi:uncharacterized lipoprotein YddW (UPF0748 family)
MRAVALLVAALAPLPAAAAQSAELRAVWVARDGLTSRAKIISTLDQLAAANINVVCVNVWSRGLTIHPSAVLAAACGYGQDPTYAGRDPLQEFLTEAHLRGIEVEAWFEYGFMFGWSGWYPGPTGVGPVLTANPSWIARDQSGNSQVPDGGGGFFTWAIHEHPAVRQFLIDLAVEVVRRYDVDGIQFDRVRYPSTAFGYDAVTSAAYLAATGQSPPGNANNAAWKAWRAARLVAFHQDLYAAVKAVRSTVRVTNAPIVMPGALNNYLQDWPAWVAGGSLDLVYPQVYRTNVADYVTTLDQQLAYFTPAQRGRIAPGIRAISGTPTSEVLGMVAANRARNLPGHVFWYAEGLYDDLPALTANYFQQPAAVPQRPPGWRPPGVVREENDPSTTWTPGFFPSSAPGASGGALRLSLPASSASDKVTYTLPVAETGLWSLLVSEPGAPGMSPQAPHVVASAAGPAFVIVDQTASVGEWREIATVWLSAGTTTVEIRAVPGQAVWADAVALVRSRWPSGAMATLGAGTTGSLGGLELALWGQSRLGGTLRFAASRTPASSLVCLGLGTTPAALPLFGGTLQLLPDVLVAGFADGLGRFAHDLAVPWQGGLVGAPLLAQALALDPAGIDGVSLSPAVATTVQ